MCKIFKEDKKITTGEEEWLSTLKKDGVYLTTREIQKARQNDGETLYNIGWEYRRNNIDKTKAFAWNYKAALENYVDAQYQSPILYQDYKQAMEWYQKAASNGHADARYNIRVLYQNGLGVSQDYKPAIEWYQKAALSTLQQEQARKDEEIKQLKEELAKLRAELNRNTGNDLNHNSSYDDKDHTENNDINYDVVPGTLKRKMN